MNYAAHVMKMPEGQGWSVYFPEIPGCFFGGETKEEAIQNARHGLMTYVNTLKTTDSKYLKDTHKRIIADRDKIQSAEILNNGEF